MPIAGAIAPSPSHVAGYRTRSWPRSRPRT